MTRMCLTNQTDWIVAEITEKPLLSDADHVEAICCHRVVIYKKSMGFGGNRWMEISLLPMKPCAIRERERERRC